MQDKEFEKRALKLMTQKEQDDYWWKKISMHVYSKFGAMSYEDRSKNGVWIGDGKEPSAVKNDT